MSLDLSPLVGLELEPVRFSWSPRDACLYALAIGAGADPADRALTWAGGPTRLFPTFGALSARMQTLRHARLPGGLSIPNDAVLHASHGVEVVDPDLPVAGSILTTGRITDVLAVRDAAIVVRECESRLGDGRLLWRHRVASHVRGATGSTRGGGLRFDRPAGSPEVVTEVRVMAQQALVYGLTGDPNPIHGDPARAPQGSTRPILHGLCTFAMVARALLLAGEDGDWRVLRSFDARFRAPVTPGDRLVVLGWRDDDGSWIVEARAGARRRVVLEGRMRTERRVPRNGG
jgi:acyl dehydratase